MCPNRGWRVDLRTDIKNGLKYNVFQPVTRLSGWRDSNSRPPAPKAGALTGLRYAPNAFKRVQR